MKLQFLTEKRLKRRESTKWGRKGKPKAVIGVLSHFTTCHPRRKYYGKTLLLLVLFIFLCSTRTSNTYQAQTLGGSTSTAAATNKMEKSQGSVTPASLAAKTNEPENVADFVTPASTMANKIMRTKGVLIRYDEVYSNITRFNIEGTEPADQNGRDYMAASFVHASMQAPNVVFRGWPEEGDEWFETGPRVFYLIGTKFEPEPPLLSSVDEKVDCRAYFPFDSRSIDRNRQIEGNPLGSSCTGFQKRNPNNLYNVTNGCSCNYDIVAGKDVVTHFIQNTTFRSNKKFVFSLCWYPGSSDGIRHPIDASNSIFHNRKKLWRKVGVKKYPIQRYWGWTECSGSPNIQKPNMNDALVISLPFSSKRANYDNGHFEDLDMESRQKLKNILDRFAHLNLPVLLLQEKKGVDSNQECQRLWKGLNCEESFSKHFLSKELEFEDGSCLARVEGDHEVRFYQAGSNNCTVNKILREHHPLWEMYRLKSQQRDKEANNEEKYDQSSGTQSLTLILTGDFHGHFFPSFCDDEETADNGMSKKCSDRYGAPYLAHVVNKIRSVEENVILLDSGDVFFGGAESGGRPEMMKLIADTQ